MLGRDENGGSFFAGPTARSHHPSGGVSNSGSVIQNQLLASLSSETRGLLEQHLHRVALSPRQILTERNHDIAYAYFIESGAASLSVMAQGCGSVEIIGLGRRDFAGFPLVLGTRKSPHRVVVQVPGQALRIQADDLIELIDRNDELRKIMLQYIQTMMIQSAQLIACNSRHELKQRLPRWLIETSENLCSDEMPVTHAAAAYALGVRRAGVTIEIAKLEKEGLIAHRRGNVRILDRQGLERVACDCHRATESMRERTFGRAPRSAAKFDCAETYDRP